MLKNLNVWNCGDALLRSLVSVASSVKQLSISNISGLSDEVWGGVVQYLGAVGELRIEMCKGIRNLCEISRREKFVRIGGEKEKGSNVLLPTSIRMLKIWGCKNLKHLSCPDTIETLDIHNCENLEHLSCRANSIQELKIWDCRSATSVSFRTEKGWQKLKSLDIWGCNSELEKELEKQLLILVNSTNVMPVLEVLRIHNWKDLKSITRFTCLYQLTTLVIEDCERIESFPNFHNLTSLKHLRIAYCPSLDGPPSLTSGSGAVSGIWPPKLDSLSIEKLKRPISEWGPLPTSLIELKLWGGFGSSLEDTY